MCAACCRWRRRWEFSSCAAWSRIPRRAVRPKGWRWALVPAMAVAVMVEWADLCLADSARTAAKQISTVLESEPGTLWFQGHWGFQYYLHALGGREVDLSHPEFRPGDVMVTPYNNTDVLFYPPQFVAPLGDREFPACRWLSTQRSDVGAGFYSGIWGPMPFVFGPAFPEKYGVSRLRHEDDRTFLKATEDR